MYVEGLSYTSGVWALLFFFVVTYIIAAAWWPLPAVNLFGIIWSTFSLLPSLHLLFSAPAGPDLSCCIHFFSKGGWLLCTTMIIYRLHFVYIILLLVNFSSGQKTFVTRAALDIHQIAVHHTHKLARDLRIAFGGYFIRRTDNKRVVYCKRAEQLPLINGGPNISFPSLSQSYTTATQTTAARTTVARVTTSSSLKPTPTQSSSPKPTPTTPTSPWKLTNSYVCPIGLLTLFST